MPILDEKSRKTLGVASVIGVAVSEGLSDEDLITQSNISTGMNRV